MKTTMKGMLILLFAVVMSHTSVSAARLSEPEELDKLVAKISDRQTKDLKTFERKTKAYFFDAQKPEVVETAVKQLQPGEAIAVIVLSNLSKKPLPEIMKMKKSGKSWQEIADATGVKMKALVKDVKDFRLGIG